MSASSIGAISFKANPQAGIKSTKATNAQSTRFAAQAQQPQTASVKAQAKQNFFLECGAICCALPLALIALPIWLLWQAGSGAVNGIKNLAGGATA